MYVLVDHHWWNCAVTQLFFWATRCWFRENLLIKSTFSVNIKLSLGLTRQTNHIIHFHKFKKSVICLNCRVETQNQPAPPFYLQTTQTNQCSATDGTINHNIKFILNQDHEKTQTRLLWNTFTSACLRCRRWCTGTKGTLASLQSKCELLWGIFFDFNTASELSLQNLTSPLFFWILVVFSLSSQWEIP